MKYAERLYMQRDEIVDDLKSSWQALDGAREQWLLDPLNPTLPDHVKRLGLEADRLGDELRKVSERLYGPWYGVDE